MCWSPQGFQELVFPLVEERIIVKQIFGSQENEADFFFAFFRRLTISYSFCVASSSTDNT